RRLAITADGHPPHRRKPRPRGADRGRRRRRRRGGQARAPGPDPDGRGDAEPQRLPGHALDHPRPQHEAHPRDPGDDQGPGDRQGLGHAPGRTRLSHQALQRHRAFGDDCRGDRYRTDAARGRLSRRPGYGATAALLAPPLPGKRLAQGLVGRLLRFALRHRRLHLKLDDLVAIGLPARSRQAAAAQAQPAPGLGPGRHFELHGAAQRRNADGRAQSRLPGRDLQRIDDVAAVDLEARMRCVLDLQQQVAALPALARQADHLPRADPARDLDLKRPAVDRDAHRPAAVYGFHGHGQARAGIAARRIAEARPAPLLLCLAAEQAFEEVAEAAVAAPAEDFFVVEPGAAAIAAEAARRRMDLVARPVAATAQLVVGLATLGVAKRLVGLVDGLELVLGPGFLADVGVVLARQPPVGGLDLGLAGAGLDAEHGVVILELHAISTCATLVPAAAG